MNVLSLFDGMSCGQIALNRIGLKPAKYYAAEIDKYAIKVTQANYPKTIQLGSVTEWRGWDINWSSIDLVTGGFPCQAWSMAGKQLGDKDERGMLFWVMLDIMKYAKSHNPKIKLLIENVKMKKEFEEYITYHTEQALGEVNKVLINSALVSAQNRNRYYWTNWHVEQPEDKGIVLADIIELNVGSEFISTTPENHNNSNQLNPKYKSQDNTIHNLESKMPTICAGTHGYALGHIPVKHDTPQRVATATDIKGHDYNKRIYSVLGKCPTLAASSGGNLEPKILCGAIRGRYIVDGKRADHRTDSMAVKTEQRVEVRKDEKTNCLTTVQKDNVLVELMPTFEEWFSKTKDYGGSREEYDRLVEISNREPTVKSYNRKDGLGKDLNKAYPLNASDWRGLNRNQTQNAVVERNKQYRKLTPIECERLQTVPDNYTNHVSNTQRYKCLGNGWTVDVIAHIFSQMELPIQAVIRQLDMFDSTGQTTSTNN